MMKPNTEQHGGDFIQVDTHNVADRRWKAVRAMKRAYHAECVQWIGDNPGEVLRLMQWPDDVEIVNGHIMVRTEEDLVCVPPGYWVVKGENGAIKCYPDEVFRVKYEVVDNG